jgi:hypothetical protein
MMQKERIGRIHFWCRVDIFSHCQENREKERTDGEDEDMEIKTSKKMLWYHNEILKWKKMNWILPSHFNFNSLLHYLYIGQHENRITNYN